MRTACEINKRERLKKGSEGERLERGKEDGSRYKEGNKERAIQKERKDRKCERMGETERKERERERREKEKERGGGRQLATTFIKKQQQ